MTFVNFLLLLTLHIYVTQYLVVKLITRSAITNINVLYSILYDHCKNYMFLNASYALEIIVCKFIAVH